MVRTNFDIYVFIDFERSWWRLFQKRMVHTNFDIYVFIVARILVCNAGQNMILEQFGRVTILQWKIVNNIPTIITYCTVKYWKCERSFLFRDVMNLIYFAPLTNANIRLSNERKLNIYDFNFVLIILNALKCLF